MYSISKMKHARLVRTQELVARTPLCTPPARGRPSRTRTRSLLRSSSLGGGPIDAFHDVARTAAAVFGAAAAAAFFVAVVVGAAVIVVVVIVSALFFSVVGAAVVVGVVVVVASLLRAWRRRPCSSVVS